MKQPRIFRGGQVRQAKLDAERSKWWAQRPAQPDRVTRQWSRAERRRMGKKLRHDRKIAAMVRRPKVKGGMAVVR